MDYSKDYNDVHMVPLTFDKHHGTVAASFGIMSALPNACL
jgi:hypothetical protein